jgi:WhiB family transcriptional regulator, redox-sensing transcriptional regulator
VTTVQLGPGGFALVDEDGPADAAAGQTPRDEPQPADAPAPIPAFPCQRHDPDLWFAESPDTLEYAKALCRPCPVRALCLAGALHRHEPWGVWGGEMVVSGAILPHKRPRGRPRKHPLPAPFRQPVPETA